jgi:hypothetical protein
MAQCGFTKQNDASGFFLLDIAHTESMKFKAAFEEYRASSDHKEIVRLFPNDGLSIFLIREI